MRKSLVELMVEDDAADAAISLSNILEDILRVAHMAALRAAECVPERPEAFHNGMETVLELAVCIAERVADGTRDLGREAKRGVWQPVDHT